MYRYVLKSAHRFGDYKVIETESKLNVGSVICGGRYVVEDELTSIVDKCVSAIMSNPVKDSCKFYWDSKNQCMVLNDGEKKYTHGLSNIEYYDRYVGAALLLAKKQFGSTTKFRKWVDANFKGKEPVPLDELFCEEETTEEAEELTEAAKRLYPDGQRVEIYSPVSKRGAKIIGTIIDYDSETDEYTIGWKSADGKESTFRIEGGKIIRTCRKANGWKNENN